MTTDADHSYAMAGRDFLRSPSIRERAKSLMRARRHSRLVRSLRILLPILAAGVGALYFISPNIHLSIGDMDASVSGIVIEKGNLRMVNPKLEGANKKQGAYAVTAKYAEQAVANPDFIRLTELTAEMNDARKGWSRLTSPTGMFETKTEKLELIGDIHVAQSNGMTALMTHANVDMKSQIVVSDQPVQVDFPSGKLDALAMWLNMDEKEVRFQGDVRVRMDQKKTPAGEKSADAGRSFAAALKSDAPVDIAAPKLTIYDARKLAHFQGGVTTDQAGSRMTSSELKILYTGDSAQETGEQGATKVERIDATGGVQIKTEDGRTANAARLNYNAGKQQLILDENVIIIQAGNTLRARRMISDLATNITRFPALGRVYGHFKPANPKPQAAPVQSSRTEPSAVSGGAAQIDLSSTRGQPIDIESDSLTVNDKLHIAEFLGKVNAVQGKMTMRSTKLIVNYSGEGVLAASEKTGGSSISSIRAEGGVLINTADSQATTSEWALFNSNDQTVTIGGNVVLTQGENVIKGDQLVIDLTTNRSRFVNRGDPSKRQRVRGLFVPKQPGAQ